MLNIQNVIDGLQILKSYNSDAYVIMQSGILHLNTNIIVSEQDAMQLSNIGWHLDGDYGWVVFSI